MKTLRSNSSRLSSKICISITAVTMIMAAAILVALWFTLFKPKEPEITASPIGLENVEFSSFSTVNVTLTMVMSINNEKNYGSFDFKNTTSYVNYRGDLVGEFPLGHDLVPARGKINLTSTSDLMVGKMIANPSFFNDFISGSLNLTSTASFRGRVSLFKLLKMRATALSTCEMSLIVASRKFQSNCKSKMSL